MDERMDDWAVWPIFIFQGIAFLLILVDKKHTKIKGNTLKKLTMVTLVATCLMIVASLIHDSTTTLDIYVMHSKAQNEHHT